MLKKLRMIALVALGGGVIFQTTGCDAFIAPVLAELIGSVVSSAISGALLGV